jgi:hypothetical protein
MPSISVPHQSGAPTPNQESPRGLLAAAVSILVLAVSQAGGARAAGGPGEGAVLKAVLDGTRAGENLVRAESFAGYKKGFRRDDGWFLCDNGADPKGRRGAACTVTLNQTRPCFAPVGTGICLRGS